MDARSKASMKYDQANTVQIVIRLNKRTDEDILKYFAKLKRLNESRQGFIKSAIRDRITPVDQASIWISDGALIKCPNDDAVRAMITDVEPDEHGIRFADGLRYSYEPWTNEIHVVTAKEDIIHRYVFDWKTGKWEYDTAQDYEDIGIEEEID